MFIAKISLPIALRSPVHAALFSQAASSPCTLFSCPPGYLAKDALVYALTSQDRSIMWLRLGPEDRDPGTLLLSLIQSARQVQPGIGGIALEKMKLNPGPLMGWPALYILLAQELADGLPSSSAIVLENVHHLAAVKPTLGLLSDHLLARLPKSLSKILMTYQDLPSSVFSLPFNYYTVKDLRIDYPDGLTLAETYHADLPKESLRKALQLIDGRDLTLTGLLAMCQEHGLGYMQSIIQRSTRADQLLTLLAHAGLVKASEDEINALMLTMLLDYCHPDVSRVSLGRPAIPHGPCIQLLSDGWLRLLYTWRAPLQAAFRSEHRLVKVANLNSVTEYLAHLGALENAVELCFADKSYAIASRLIAQAAEEMMNLGQWVTLEDWLNKLPDNLVQEWPRLVYIQGEIAAVHGNLTKARRTFAVSSSLFSARGESEEACQSLIAESTLAAWEGDKNRARNYAQKAATMARQAGLTNRLGDINWQLASLAATSNTLEEALTYISPTSETITDPYLKDICHQAARLLGYQLELQTKCRSQYQSYLETVQAEQSNLALLKQLMNSPASNLPDIFARRGWSHTPLMLKMPAPVPKAEEPEAETKPKILKRLIQALSIHLPGDMAADSGGFYIPALEHNSVAGVLIQSDIEPVQFLSTAQPVTSELVTFPVPSAQPEAPVTGLISAYLLGTFHLFINEKPLTRLPSSRGLAVLKYLIMHRSQLIPRDILMDTFWPDASPESARNSLNVAMHGLRQSLRDLTEKPVIAYWHGNYGLESDIELWIDVEQFERYSHNGVHLEVAGELEQAIRHFEIAINLYQGDFLEGDPYEEWTILPRERLRFAYLDVLGRLSNINFDKGEYSACLSLCQRILECDNCREEAHQRLMVCYSRLGQTNLALRQYQVCVEALRAHLDVEPEAATTQLAERIRRHERV